MPRAEVIAHFERYVDRFRCRSATTRASLDRTADPWATVFRPQRAPTRRNVVIATGLHQQPKLPPFAAGFPRVTQIHSSQYRNPGALPEGAVLVVGSAQSGCQIAEELYQNGREVFLTGAAGRVPRRYRGDD